ncbi:hypothetical protein FE374_05960 [Georgenia yuyongxinii]|uniref:PepSY domain-containing protein n=1 Tax=Georgenia yuyongxinii TaxID=2589797 RepID=A0A5B8C0I5_9MICO|nr:PepSY domain-containing protein [Georgenia yuyongxinii]QDC24229.1 hypothetical protein FE374_05960 [Georgenia yuyongxinii]
MDRRRAAAAAATVLLLAGCGSTREEVPLPGIEQSPAGEADTPSASPGTPSPSPTADDGADADAAATGDAALTAVRTAENAVPGGRAADLDRDDDDGDYEITVVGAGGAEDVAVGSDGTQVLRQQPDDDLDDDDRAALGTATVTLADAIDAAVAQSGGVVDDVELETEDNGVVWKVKVRAGDGEREVRVDAADGTVR